MKQMDLKSVRQVLGNHVGSRVRVKAHRGRHRIEISEGIITNIYPSIFTITLVEDEVESSKTVSFSYADILTKEVQLMLS